MVIDLHCDTLTAFQSKHPCADTLNDPQSHFSLSRIPAGANWAQCCAIFLPNEVKGEAAIRYYARYQRSFAGQCEAFSSLALPCRTAGDIERAWSEGKTALLLTVENGSALAGDLDRVETLARDGVVMMTLAWNGQNEIASGWDTDSGLSDFGRQVIPAMEELGILVDVSHLNDRSFFDVLERAEKPLVASHSNARCICSHRRNLTDDQIRALVARRSLIGLNFYHRFLRDGGHAAPEDFLRHLTHILELGGEDCIALGSDFDGADVPGFLDSPSKVLALPQRFACWGLSPALWEKLLYRNALEFFRRNLSD